MSHNDSTLMIDNGPLETKTSISMPIWAKALIALAPALFFLLLFTIYPIINTTIISFIKNFSWEDGQGSFALSSFFSLMDKATNIAKWQGIWDAEGLGTYIPGPMPYFTLDNYIIVLKDPLFIRALGNTAILTIISVPLTIIISLLLAVSLNSIKALRATYQTIFFLPYVTNSIALGMVFNALFTADPGGIMNQVVTAFGGSPISWINPLAPLGTIPSSKFSIGLAITVQTVWSGLAFKILVFMSGLASIDRQYYDAARIDGAARSTIFRKITVPLLSPQILYITITSFIGAFKAYQSVISLIGKGPTNFGGADGLEWITVVGYIYKYRVADSDLVLASAAAVVLLIIILLITLVQMQVSKKRVHY